jgi:hypothetical protein
MVETVTDEQMIAEARKYYDERLRETLEPEHLGKYVAVDLQTRRYAVAADPVAAYDQLDGEGCSPPYVLLRVGSLWTFEGLPG